MHFRQEVGGQWHRHSGRQDRVDAAARAERRNAIRCLSTRKLWSVDPLRDLARVEHPPAVEAPGALTAGKELAVTVAEAMDGLEIGAIVHHANVVVEMVGVLWVVSSTPPPRVEHRKFGPLGAALAGPPERPE